LDKKAERKLQRAQLLDLRESLADRTKREIAVQRRVADWLRQADVHSVGFYYPVRGEPDLRSVVAQWLSRDARRIGALPVISASADGPGLEYHGWTADSPMQAGVSGIPVPAHGRVLQPECLLIPCVGFDHKRFRLGYGGGYFDRLLARVVPWPLAVGIAFESTRVESIDPQPHDVQLDVIITDVAQY